MLAFPGSDGVFFGSGSREGCFSVLIPFISRWSRNRLFWNGTKLEVYLPSWMCMYCTVHVYVYDLVWELLGIGSRETPFFIWVCVVKDTIRWLTGFVWLDRRRKIGF